MKSWRSRSLRPESTVWRFGPCWPVNHRVVSVEPVTAAIWREDAWWKKANRSVSSPRNPSVSQARSWRCGLFTSVVRPVRSSSKRCLRRSMWGELSSWVSMPKRMRIFTTPGSRYGIKMVNGSWWTAIRRLRLSTTVVENVRSTPSCMGPRSRLKTVIRWSSARNWSSGIHTLWLFWRKSVGKWRTAISSKASRWKTSSTKWPAYPARSSLNIPVRRFGLVCRLRMKAARRPRWPAAPMLWPGTYYRSEPISSSRKGPWYIPVMSWQRFLVKRLRPKTSREVFRAW